MASAKTEAPSTMGVAYGVSNAHLNDKVPTPESVEQQAVTVSEGHRVGPGKYLTVLVGDTYEGSAPSLTWLSLEFKDQGAIGTYTLPHKDVRVFYSSLGLANIDESYSEAVRGTVAVDDENQLLTVDLLISLVTASQPLQRSERHVVGKYLYHKASVSELRWPWKSH